MIRRKMIKFISHSVKETMTIGSRLARHLKVGNIVALSGIFGAGKTYFTKGIAQGLGIKRLNEVKSPSFVLCNIYQGKRLKLYHFDAQRLPDAKELLKLGLTECFYDGVCVMEWAEKLPRLNRQPNVIQVKFTLKGKTKRLIEIGYNRLHKVTRSYLRLQ